MLASIFVVTLVAVSMFGHSMEDGALTMCLVLAADSCQRAAAGSSPSAGHRRSGHAGGIAVLGRGLYVRAGERPAVH